MERQPLAQYFEAEDHGDNWHFYCRICHTAWRLQKPIEGVGAGPGRLLDLLRHAATHRPVLRKRLEKQGK